MMMRGIDLEDGQTRGALAAAVFALVLCVAFVSTSSAATQGVQIASLSSMCWAFILCIVAVIGLVATFRDWWKEAGGSGGLGDLFNGGSGGDSQILLSDSRFAFGRVEPAYKASVDDKEMDARGNAMKKYKIDDFAFVGTVLEAHLDTNALSYKECAEKCFLNADCSIMQHGYQGMCKNFNGPCLKGPCILKSNKIPDKCKPLSDPQQLCMDHDAPGTFSYIFPDKTLVDGQKSLGQLVFENLRKCKEQYSDFLKSNTQMKELLQKIKTNDKVGLSFAIVGAVLDIAMFFPVGIFAGVGFFIAEMAIIAADITTQTILGKKLSDHAGKLAKTTDSLSGENRDITSGRYDNSIQAYDAAAILAMNCANIRTPVGENASIG
jgi:hypothetical protein